MIAVFNKICYALYTKKDPETPHSGGIYMSSEFDTVMKLCREPMIAVSSGIITHLNQAAQELFDGIAVGKHIRGFIPEHMLNISDAAEFTSCIDTSTGIRTLTASNCGEMQILHISGDDSDNRTGYLSDSMLTSLLSSLFNTGLALDKVADDDSMTAQSKTYLSIVSHNYHNILRLVGNLHSAVQAAENTLNLNRSHFDLDALCAKVVESLNPLLPHREFKYVHACAPVYISADAEKIERVLLNIISNSYQHTKQGGKITLSAELRDNRAVITIRDNGSGISPEILRDVFSRYNTRLSEENLSLGLRPGLGLTVSRGIVSQHGGTLVIDSKVGEGTTVYISLPTNDGSGKYSFRDTFSTRTVSDTQLLLTELSDILDSSHYAKEYID